LDPLTPITEIKPPLPAQLAGEQQQRLPFSQGQLLQGIVSAKGEGRHFTLNIGGLSLTAESSAPLQVGQQLDLQVTSLAPRLELQVVGDNPVNRWLGVTIPLLGQQSILMSEVGTLANNAQALSLASRTTQETLLFYAKNAGGETQAAAASVPLFSQLRDLLSTIPIPLTGQNLQDTYTKIGALLQQFSLVPSMPPVTTQQADQLAPLFEYVVAPPGTEAPPIATATPPEAPTAFTGTTPLLTVLDRLPLNGSTALPPSLSILAPLIQESGTLPATHPLRQLLTFLIQTETASIQSDEIQATGRQLEEYLNRLGINMERLLAENKPEEAAKTLKFALLELSQYAEATEKSSVAPGQLAKTVELYQLLQLRLASESLFFLPLPFSFLQQGYLLADAESSRKQAGAESKPTGEKVALHLQLEGLGNLQIDIQRQDGRVTLRFFMEDAEKARFIADNRAELEQWLTTDRLASIQFLIGATEPAKTLLKMIAGDGAAIVNTRA